MIARYEIIDDDDPVINLFIIMAALITKIHFNFTTTIAVKNYIFGNKKKLNFSKNVFLFFNPSIATNYSYIDKTAIFKNIFYNFHQKILGKFNV